MKKKANVLKIANDQREYGEEVKKEVKMLHIYSVIQWHATLFTYERIVLKCNYLVQSLNY